MCFSDPTCFYNNSQVLLEYEWMQFFFWLFDVLSLFLAWWGLSCTEHLKCLACLLLCLWWNFVNMVVVQGYRCCYHLSSDEKCYLLLCCDLSRGLWRGDEAPRRPTTLSTARTSRRPARLLIKVSTLITLHTLGEGSVYDYH